ncbi:MAG: transporter substrate-binding protein [Lachnospiraceae bacterium]|jgi:iron complex transport system substrate-binding protein|nr:transporter substrate-binding protein [Lachnospiraceae bacterium]
MKKILILTLLIAVNALIFSACGKQRTDVENSTTTGNSTTLENTGTEVATSPESEETEVETSATTITYQSENGPIEVPAEPKRVVVLNSFISGTVMSLNVNIVGIDSWAMANPLYEPYLKDATEVSDENIELILELEPDLIIAASNNNNIDKLNQIAPTVTYTYGNVDYLTQIQEVGKLLNKEEEAKVWVDDFKARAKSAGEEIRKKIGEDATVSVMEMFDKQLYVYGDNWGRGTEILYQEMKLNMPETVKNTALKAGYYAISPEVFSDYAGDYIIYSKSSSADHSFQETESYKNIPAVKNNQIFEFDASIFYFNDPITLNYQLEMFIQSFLGN